VKRFALRGGTAFVVFKDIKISLVFFVSFLGDAKKKENINVIETSSNLKTSKHFSIQFSIKITLSDITYSTLVHNLKRFRIAAIALHGMGEIPYRSYRLA
jgi:hypothetical protein